MNFVICTSLAILAAMLNAVDAGGKPCSVIKYTNNGQSPNVLVPEVDGVCPDGQACDKEVELKRDGTRHYTMVFCSDDDLDCVDKLTCDSHADCNRAACMDYKVLKNGDEIGEKDFCGSRYNDLQLPITAFDQC